MGAVYEAAIAAQAAGLSVVPPMQDGSKRPITSWTRYQKTPATIDELDRWYASADRTGLGLVCGKVSRGLELFEFETADIYASFLQLVEDHGQPDEWEHVAGGYLERTPGGGIHILWHTEHPGPNTKLASRADKTTLIETRGEGGYAVIAPSNGTVHPSQGVYELLRGGIASIATVTADKRETWLALARMLSEEAPAEPIGRTPPSEKTGSRPGDQFNAETSWDELLPQYGWRRVKHQGEETHWRRPGKNEGNSATTNYKGSGVLKVFSTSTPLDTNQTYTPFGFYTAMEHAGDFKAAARALGEHGFGQPTLTVLPGGAPPQTPADAPTRDAADMAPHLTDLGNAKRLVARHGRDLRYCAARNTWLVWTGTHWCIDDTGEVARRAKETILALYADAATLPDAERVALVRHAMKSEGAARIAAMLTLAESELGIPVRMDGLDRDSWLLSVANGTLDLRTGQLRRHDHDDLITRFAPVAYDVAATCPTWLAFLDRVLAGNAETIAFVQRALGYSLTGDVSERCLFVLHGSGRNGKSTLVETMQGVLTDHAHRVSTETLLASRQNTIPNDVAALKGARFVFASEANENRRLDEAKVKDLTGGDTVTARFLHGEFFSFRPELKLWLSTNHKPQVRGTDDAIWDRIRLVPFTVRIPDDEQDKHLRDKLLAEASGILAWCITGCLSWQRDGLGEPATVRDATAAYRAESDLIGQFVDENCALSETARSTAKALYGAYVAWSKDAGEEPITQQAFGRRLSERGFDSARLGKSKATTWIGVGLLSDGDTGGHL